MIADQQNNNNEVKDIVEEMEARNIQRGESGVNEKFNCGKCSIEVKTKTPAVQCEGICEKWFHNKCIDMKKEEYEVIIMEHPVVVFGPAVLLVHIFAGYVRLLFVDFIFRFLIYFGD